MLASGALGAGWMLSHRAPPEAPAPAVVPAPPIAAPSPPPKVEAVVVAPPAPVAPIETTDPGELLLGALVEAIDRPSGASIAAEMTELELAIESPSLLVIDATGAPAAADVGQPVEVSVTVVNEGEAAARLVAVQLDAVEVVGAALQLGAHLVGPMPGHTDIACCR